MRRWHELLYAKPRRAATSFAAPSAVLGSRDRGILGIACSSRPGAGPPHPAGSEGRARLRFDEAAEEAIENLANVLQWHRNSQHKGTFVAQKDGRAGASKKHSSCDFFFPLDFAVVPWSKFVSK